MAEICVAMSPMEKLFLSPHGDGDDGKFSILQQLRQVAEPTLPVTLRRPVQVVEEKEFQLALPSASERLAQLFPSTWGQPLLKLVPHSDTNAWDSHQPLRLGILLSGGENNINKTNL